MSAAARRPIVVQVDGTPGAPGRLTGGVAAVIRDADGRVLGWRCAGIKTNTNNEAEYQAVIFGLDLVLRRFVDTPVRCLTDSRIVVDQLAGRSAVHVRSLQSLHLHALTLARRFEQIEFVAIPRTLNRLADVLAWEAAAGQQDLIAFLSR